MIIKALLDEPQIVEVDPDYVEDLYVDKLERLYKIQTLSRLVSTEVKKEESS